MAASPSEDDVCLMGVCVKRVYRRLCDVRACQRVTNAAVSYHVWRCYDTLTTLSLKDAHTHRDRHTQECIWSILTSKHFRSAVSRVQQVVLSFLKRFSFFFSLVAVKWYLQSRLLVFKCEDFRGDSKKNPQRLIAWKKKSWEQVISRLMFIWDVLVTMWSLLAISSMSKLTTPLQPNVKSP